MQEQFKSESLCTTILISVKDGYTPEAVGGKLSETFPDNTILLSEDLEGIYMNAIPAMGVFLDVVIGVAAVISALVILLTMYTTVTERTRQIGILKSLGMTNSKIAWIITQEALLLSFFGVLGGILLTIIVRFVLTRVTTIEVEIDPVVLLITLVVGLAGGALGALYPALRAARLDAVEALSYE
jgi:putative ABC transport system permease protein